MERKKKPWLELSDYDFYLPQELIAQKPIEPRDRSQLLTLDKRTWKKEMWRLCEDLLKLWKNDVIVINKTKVINARLRGELETGLKVEIFLHKQISDNKWNCLVYPWKKLKPWKKVYFNFHNNKRVLEGIIKEISESWRIVQFNKWWLEFLEIIEKLWEIPLPPYIKERLNDQNRYQTVFNEISWSVAAPTAWLHFTPKLIEKLEKKWVIFEKVLLHVWLWTFYWVETNDITKHNIHSEYIELEKDTSIKLNKYKSEWKRIIAVWTTSVRVLESFSDERWILSYGHKNTNIFIYPWYNWKFVDAIITNFHLPKSSLLMLVSSFAWFDNIKDAYEFAIKNKFRFYSFWDAMFIK